MREGANQRAADAPDVDVDADAVDSDVDAYLAFCERALLPDREEEVGVQTSEHDLMEGCEQSNQPLAGAGERLLAEYFPVKGAKARGRTIEIGGESEGDRRDEVPVKELPAIELVEEGEGKVDGRLRPGARYAMYSAQDVLGRLPEEYERVLKRGEKWTGVQCEDLCAVVERFERRLLRVWKRRRRETVE